MTSRRHDVKNPYVRYQPLKKPPVSLHPTTLWDYPSQHYGKGTQGSPGYRGATPSHVIWNVVERYTQPGALVVDPFCGSGTTIDVCADLKRKVRGFDIAPPRERQDVEKADARKLPLQKGTVDLVFMDPPYADNLRYSGDPACLGELTAEDGAWQEAMVDVLGEARRVLKPKGVLAIFLCDILKVRDGRRVFLPLGLYAAAAAEQAGFIPDEHVAVVRRGKTLNEGRGARQAERQDFMLRGFNHLMIFTPYENHGE